MWPFIHHGTRESATMTRLCVLLSALAAMCAVATAGDPVQVYILMGQSNMLGEGKISPVTKNGTLEYAVHTEGRYPYLWNKANNSWAVRDDVRYTFIMGSGNASFEKSKLEHNEWMTVTGNTIGPELGIGNYVGNYSKQKVLILKACIGNRALGWDLLPPGSPGFEFTDSKGQAWEYAAYHQTPNKWKKGTTPVPVNWMAGEQYDGDTNRTMHILNNFSAYFPGEDSYEIAGFFWWQGNRDSFDTGLSTHYEVSLVRLIKTLREQFKAPSAKFVTASLGETVMNSTNNGGKILQAMLDVDGRSGKYPEFKGNVRAVYTHPLSMGGSSGAHYNNDARTYMNVGQAMGDAMVELLKGDF
eukprot:m.476708 g.476708  ORF g.476708 m.476708 type:complete len:357 (+) comp20622_c0_seq1:1351-2421(+)